MNQHKRSIQITFSHLPAFLSDLSAELLLKRLLSQAEYHNWLTGKLSDFCGLFVFATFWSALFPSRKLTVYFSTALLFPYWKSPYSQSFLNFFSQNFYHVERVVDVTD
jgi:hypothetical protein